MTAEAMPPVWLDIALIAVFPLLAVVVLLTLAGFDDYAGVLLKATVGWLAVTVIVAFVVWLSQGTPGLR